MGRRHHREMEGDNKQRRAVAREARKAGKSSSEVAGTLGSSKQRTEADENASHQERIDLKRQGKHNMIGTAAPRSRPGSRDADTPDRDRHTRL